jgi:glycosyltransferase involved in cell wall biosynthesis
MDMKVSVLVTTYNHAKYINQTLNSILMQDVNFDYEIVIGEDASTDRTREIVLELQKRHSDKVRVLLRDTVEAERERAAGLGGQGGFVNCLQACKGQYVAWLDGDDYWTSPHKLQKQVDFLESHPDFAISFHNATMIYEDGSQEARNLLPPNHQAVSSLSDLLLVNFIPTCSAVFRRGLFGELPDWFYTLKIGDWPIHIMNAQHGKIGYINEVMAAYRLHPGAFWSARSQESQRLEILKMLDHIDVYLGLRYKRQIRASKAGWYYQLAEITYRKGDRAGTRMFLRQYIWFSQFRDPWKTISLFLRGYLPGLYRGLRTLRNRSRSNVTLKNGMAKDSKG